MILLNLIIFASPSTLLYKGRRCQLRRGRFNSSTCSNFVECIVQRREHFDIGLCLCVVVAGLGQEDLCYCTTYKKKKICVIVLKQGGVDQYECLPYQLLLSLSLSDIMSLFKCSRALFKHCGQIQFPFLILYQPESKSSLLPINHYSFLNPNLSFKMF